MRRFPLNPADYHRIGLRPKSHYIRMEEVLIEFSENLLFVLPRGLEIGLVEEFALGEALETGHVQLAAEICVEQRSEAGQRRALAAVAQGGGYRCHARCQEAGLILAPAGISSLRRTSR